MGRRWDWLYLKPLHVFLAWRNSVPAMFWGLILEVSASWLLSSLLMIEEIWNIKERDEAWRSPVLMSPSICTLADREQEEYQQISQKMAIAREKDGNDKWGVYQDVRIVSPWRYGPLGVQQLRRRQQIFRGSQSCIKAGSMYSQSCRHYVHHLNKRCTNENYNQLPTIWAAGCDFVIVEDFR